MMPERNLYSRQTQAVESRTKNAVTDNRRGAAVALITLAEFGMRSES